MINPSLLNFLFPFFLGGTIFVLVLRKAGICLLTVMILSADAVDEVYLRSLMTLGA
jgi:hypothetical protein